MDSPTYQEMTSAADPAKEAPHPTRQEVQAPRGQHRGHHGELWWATTSCSLLPTYLTSYTSMEASAAQLATDIALVTYIFIIFGAGKVSDIVGRKKTAAGLVRGVHRCSASPRS